MNKKLIIGLVLVIGLLLGVIFFQLVGKDNNLPIPDSEPATISIVDTVKAAVTPKPDTLDDMISVNNPFGGIGDHGMRLSTSTHSPFTDLVAMMDYDVDAPITNTFDGNFNGTIMGNTDITSGEKVEIIHELRYNADSVVAWTEAQGDNFTWNQKPDRLAIPFGSVVLVTYKTQDATAQWTGDIKIIKPKE